MPSGGGGAEVLWRGKGEKCNGIPGSSSCGFEGGRRRRRKKEGGRGRSVGYCEPLRLKAIFCTARFKQREEREQMDLGISALRRGS